MIRGSVLPLQRDGLWRLIRQRTGLFERGFRVVAEQIELGTAGLPPVDGLVRDASGAPVLVFATDDRDPSLCARLLAAHAFWTRNADGMSRALPEADLRDGASCRLIVVGVAMRSEAVAAMQRLQLPGLEIVEVDAFRLAGQERIVVRTIAGHIGNPEAAPLDPALRDSARDVFEAVVQFIRRLDAKIRLDGDRFSRRASYEGRLLGDFWYADEAVHALVSGGSSRRIDTDAAMRSVCDHLARRYLQVHGPEDVGAQTDSAHDRVATGEELEVGDGPMQVPAEGLESVRACLLTSKLSQAEREALLDPTFGREVEERTSGG